MEALKLGLDEILEVLSTYTATQQPIPAVAATPGWYVVGAFRMRVSFEIIMQGVVSVSHPSLTLRARMFDVTAGLPVPIQLSTQSTVDAYAQTGAVALVGLHIYQMQVEVTGGAGDDLFGSMKSLNLAAATS